MTSCKPIAKMFLVATQCTTESTVSNLRWVAYVRKRHRSNTINLTP